MFVRLIQFFKTLLTIRYIYCLQKFEPIKENGCYILKEFGTHTCIKVTAEDIFQTDLLHSINPDDIIFITRFEERELQEKQRFHLVEERRDFSFVVKNAWSRRQLGGRELLKDSTIVEHLDPTSLVRIAWTAGMKDGRKLSEAIRYTEKTRVPKKPQLEIIK